MTDDFENHNQGPRAAQLRQRVLYTFHLARVWETKAFVELFEEFPRLTVVDLSKETNNRYCSICQELYQAKYDVPGEADDGEQPIKLACGHIIGHQCLQEWLPQNTCPMCRRPLLEGLETRSGRYIIAQDDDGVLRNLRVAGQFMEKLQQQVDRWGIDPGAPALAETDEAHFPQAAQESDGSTTWGQRFPRRVRRKANEVEDNQIRLDSEVQRMNFRRAYRL